MSNKYEVYVALINGKIGYIGSGQAGKRHKHITSGVSHVYLLNKLHFKSPEKVKVMILHDDLTKERSLELELELIQHYQPPLNSIGTKNKNCKYVPITYFEGEA